MNDYAMIALSLGFIFGVWGVIFVIWIATTVLSIISYWFMFNKAGEEGWKAIIPFYSNYIMTKITWDKKFFWIMLCITIGQVLAIVILIFSVFGVALSAGATKYLGSQTPSASMFMGAGVTFFVLYLIFIGCGVAGVVFNIISNFRISKAFGHEAGYTVGIVLVPCVFLPIIAFGKSPYLGNVYKAERAKREKRIAEAQGNPINVNQTFNNQNAQNQSGFPVAQTPVNTQPNGTQPNANLQGNVNNQAQQPVKQDPTTKKPYQDTIDYLNRF